MNKKLRQKLKTFIRDVNQESEEIEANNFGMMISQAGAGTLILDHKEAMDYSRIVQALIAEYVPSEDLSSNSVKKQLNTLVFDVIDIRNKSIEPFDSRLERSLGNLHDQLTGPQVIYKFYVPINGLESESLPFHFGGIRFLEFGPAHERQLLKVVRSNPESCKSVKRLRQTELWTSPCASVEVQSRDFASARLLARKRVRSNLDCINFFSDLIPYNHGWLSLRGEAVSEVEVTAAISGDLAISTNYNRSDPISSFDLNKLPKSGPLRRAWKSANTLLRLTDRKSTEELLRTSLIWAGRASVEPRREQAFLLNMIALESLLLPETGGELSYRLALRTSRLLRKDKNGRLSVQHKLKELYSVRSKIVHSGEYEVSEDHLGRLRALTKLIILRMLRRKILWRYSREEYRIWLEELVTR